MQTASRFIDDEANASQIIRENVRSQLTMLSMLPQGAGPLSSYPKIIVYPEFSFQGTVTRRWTFDSWRKWLKGVAVTIPGEVSDEFGKKSAEYDMYIQGCVWEKSDAFPDHFFESVFITDPKGKVAYLRRRVALSSNLGATTPGEIMTDYLKKHGPDPVNALFPVLETPYGNIGGIMCGEAGIPEITRALTLNGAEIILHSNSEAWGWGNFIDGQYSWGDIWRRGRAYENMVYFASGDIGEMINCNMPRARNRGHSEVLDFRGNTMSRIDTPGEAIAGANCDIGLLRAARRDEWGPTSSCPLINAVFAPVYESRIIWPENKKPLEADKTRQLRETVLQGLVERKILHLS
ncbi:MAG: hypothetical protein JRN67_08560 [Nitrososphaerota archaeon]|nr:hypothetical protein [Nitrososphaerota archaeon]